MKRCLIVVDYQVDFVSGALGNADAAAIDGAIAALIRKRRSEGYDVIFTLDTHEEGYMATREGRYLPVPHCIRGTAGHALYGQVAGEQREGDAVFCKETFGSKGLYEHMRREGYGRLELCGVVTNICVISNAVLVKTALPEADVAVHGDCCASNDARLHQAALDVMASFQVDVI